MYCYLDGKLTDKNQKNIRIENRGFTFADGLFEVIRIIDGIPLFLEDHHKRMKESADFLKIPFHYTSEECYQQSIDLIEKNQLYDGELYWELTRGDDEYREHGFRDEHQGTFAILTIPLRHINPENWEKGVSLTLYPDLRHQLCEHKTINLLANCMAKNFAYSQKSYDSIMFRVDDKKRKYITEGGSSTYFFVKDGIIATPEIDNILPGITRKKVLTLCKEFQIPVVQRRVFLNEIKHAEEIFLASTVSKVMPVNKVGEKLYQVDGKITRTLMGSFVQLVEKEMEAKRNVSHV
ncbi:MAG: aminotransferase class IV [Thermotogota bacterium]|nr:aminotransferase class IV [Thermotogota bacterium]